MTDESTPGTERERVDTEPVTDHASKTLMLRAERGDKIVADVMGEAAAGVCNRGDSDD